MVSALRDANSTPTRSSGTHGLPLVERYALRLKDLQDEAREWKPLWEEVQRFAVPWRGRFLLTDQDHVNARLQQDIYNNTVQDCIITAASGVQGILCNEGSRWFGMTHPSYEARNNDDARWWMDDMENDLYWAIGQSRFYGHANDVFVEQMTFGHGTMLLEASSSLERPFRAMTLTAGAHWLGNNADGDVDTCYRKYKMTAGQMLDYFGEDAPYPFHVRDAIYNKRMDRSFYLYQAIQPWGCFDKRRNRIFAYESVHWVEGCHQDDRVLLRKGYRTRPFVSVRWGNNGDGPYAYSPTMMTLADIHSLYGISRDIFNASNKTLNPPLAGDADLTQEQVEELMRPGSFLSVQEGQAGPKIRPVIDVRYDLQSGSVIEEKVEDRIKRIFMQHLFFTTLLDTKEMTKAEIEARAREQLFILGPMIFRNQAGFLIPSLTRIYDMRQADSGAGGYAAPVSLPESLESQEFEFTFTSDMSKAQELLQYAGLDNFVNIAGAIITANNESGDKVDYDELLDIARMRDGLPSRVIKADKAVEEVRAARAAAAQNEAEFQRLQGAVDAANKLGKTPMGQGSALDAALGDETSGEM